MRACVRLDASIDITEVSALDTKTIRKLRVGSRVFHPKHGVVTVLAIEKREFGDDVQDFYVLELARGGKMWLPTGNVADAGLRDIVSAAKARELMKKVNRPCDTSSAATWKQRAATYADGLKSGSPERYTEILSELLARSRANKLSSGDKQALELAMGHFVGEVSIALGQSHDEVEAGLEEACAEAAS